MDALQKREISCPFKAPRPLVEHTQHPIQLVLADLSPLAQQLGFETDHPPLFHASNTVHNE
jgi:hypothetical protein